MPFKKGQSGNPKGKAEGTKSEKTIQWELLGEAIVNKHTERFNRVLGELEDTDFMDQYLKVLEYFKPKLNRSELKHEGEIKTDISLNLLPPSTDGTPL